ncbi:MAG: beta-ketoacyl synthase N-terminal-like domain-containing protein [Acidobacteriota bacterium]
MRRAAVYGWGVVAPKSPDIEAFARNLESSDNWLEPFHGFGPDNFLVGKPAFDFSAYEPWIVERFKPNRFSQLSSKMGLPIQYAIGSFLQALGQNEGMEEELQRLGQRAHICVGTGLGDLEVQSQQALALARAQRRWDHFWSLPERNSARRAFEAGDVLEPGDLHGAPPVDSEAVPPRPDGATAVERDELENAWWGYWAAHSPELHQYLAEQREVETVAVEGDVESGKISAMKDKQRRLRRLQRSWGAPEPPWLAVSPNLLWNIDNIAASQISMLGQITGATFAVGAACATFGVILKLALDAIRRDEADAVVIGATDPPPHALTVGGFYAARVISADARLSKPLTQLRGTHVAGGSVVWIVGARDYFEPRGFKPLGLEPVSVAVTSDADHIITPSQEGPTAAIQTALAEARRGAAEPAASEAGEAAAGTIASWDLHATATPGDYNEVEMVRSLLPESVLMTARKGTFGHGMSAGGGWELTAQYLGYERGELFPTPLQKEELNGEIGGLHGRFVYDSSCAPSPGDAGKLSMGVGGVNACVISRPLAELPEDD